MLKRQEEYLIRNKDITVIDSNTGEIYGEIKGVDKDTVTQIKVAKEIYLTEDEKRFEQNNFRKDAPYIRLFVETGMILNDYFTSTEIAAIVLMTSYVCYDDCVLRHGRDHRGKPVTIKDLAERSHKSIDTFRKVMYSLRDKEAIGFHSTGTVNNGSRWITINPYLFCRGMLVDNWVAEFYKNSRWNNPDLFKTN